MRLALSRIHYPVRTLGPGARVGIWFQGCSIRCKGCVSLDTWDPDRGQTTTDAVLHAVTPWLAEADGVTISGGEPFDQGDALLDLLTRIRSVHRGDILVYSGHSLERLSERLPAFEGMIDALITEPFQLEAPQTLALRGSDNQRLVCLTPLGELRFRAFERPSAPEDRTLDIMFDDDSGEVFMAGIPRRGDLRRLAHLLAEDGHSAATSEDKIHRQ